MSSFTCARRSPPIGFRAFRVFRCLNASASCHLNKTDERRSCLCFRQFLEAEGVGWGLWGDDVAEGLTLLLFRLVGGIAYGDDDGRLLAVGQGEQLLAPFCVEVAHPAGGQSLFRCCQTEMFHGDGDVDVAMLLAVAAHPFFVVEDGGDDVGGGCREPVAVVALLQRFPAFVAADDMEAPGLPVDGRRCHPHTLHDVVELFGLYGCRPVGPAAVSVSGEF